MKRAQNRLDAAGVFCYSPAPPKVSGGRMPEGGDDESESGMRDNKPGKRCVTGALLGMLLALCGCGETPFAQYGLVDPWSRRSWREDERYGPTYHTKREALRKQRSQVRSLPPEEQERKAVELAERLRDEPHPVLRAELVRTLGEIRSDIAAEALRAATQDADADVRVVALETWGRRGGEEARQVLCEVLGSDTDLDVRIAATRELGRFRSDPQAMQAIKLALDENNPALQYRAVESLKNMTGKDYGADLVAWKEYVDGGHPPDPPRATIAERLRSWY
jgi:HEAT repeat protein